MANIITPLSTDDPGLANRYLADQLSDEERTAFELRMIDNPALLREVEATARFKVGLQHAQESGQLALLLTPRPSPAPYLAFAAMLALVAVGIGLWRTQDISPMPWIGASIQQLAQVRGTALPTSREYTVLRVRAQGDADALIDLPDARSAIALRVLPDVSEPGSRHLVRLIPMQGEPAQQPSVAGIELVADAGGYVSLFIDSASLQTGLYRLEVSSPAAPPGDTERFLLRFQSAGARP